MRDGAVIAVAMGVMNLTTYGFVILAARLLGPAEYGALAAVMGVLLVVNVLSLGLQATGARRVSAAPERRPEIEREVLATSYGSALALGLLVLAATPVITSTLNLDSWAAAALIAATAVPLTVMGGQAGILQGERRWAPLAGIYLAVGLGRIGFGTLALIVEPNTLGAMVGVTLGALVPVLVGWIALRRPDRTSPSRRVHRARQRWAPGGVLRETFHNSHALTPTERGTQQQHPPVPRRDRHHPAHLGHRPAAAGGRGAARAHRPLGRLDRRRGRLRQRGRAAPPLHQGAGRQPSAVPPYVQRRRRAAPRGSRRDRAGRQRSRRTLPVSVRGSSSRNTQVFGRFGGASCSPGVRRQLGLVRPSPTTAAQTRCPQRSSGTPKTATSVDARDARAAPARPRAGRR